jgi:hypothetical protein
MVQQQQVNSSHSGGRLLFARLLLGTGAVVVKKTANSSGDSLQWSRDGNLRGSI